MSTRVSNPTQQRYLELFEQASSELTKAEGRHTAALEAGDKAAIFASQQDMQEQIEIMSGLSNMSQTIHNMLMKLLEKLNIRV
ncbi:MAG: hypothetical protein KDD70_03250 [Bdellovibrionales bacterium]|nr:hypothetical protein [Bdellovibrionales bacterium]